MSVPAHKNVTHPPGQIVFTGPQEAPSQPHRGPFRARTLGEYVGQIKERMERENRFETFDAWWQHYNAVNGCPPAHVVAEAAWNYAKGLDK